ncbi:NAD(P)-binding protein [Corynespora cassiicola Philippines]|uniref:NAD(P)-binding protein n=1 Tax=Corynespora cassiicola Philippines TaxID=1448308 RepID=A0A2T2NZN8_CORCC|nr:NAD(P)-binding protein [Corynespora cassiicola Philippines]
MTKLFITGATGYIGGDALYAIASTFPTLSITALVRNSDKGAKIAAQHPKIRLVYGDLDSTSVLSTEAANADIVLHCADADHQPAAEALVAGLAQRSQPGFLIHTSGTGVLSFADFDADTFGIRREKVYDDWEGVGEVTSLPETALHRKIDKVVIEAGKKNPGKLFSAVVCPPCIYGPGRGPDNQKSVQVYRMARAAIRRGKGWQVGEGENVWTQIHVQDLSEVFVALVAAAIEGGGKATWNEEGYYFAENGSFVWGEVARKIAKIANEKGYIKTAEVDSLSKDEADKLEPFSYYYLGVNSRAKAIRANKLFGWAPKKPSVFELLADIVDGEAKDLGVTKSHAEKAAGEA